MATILAIATGDWTASTTWTGGVIPGPGDVAVANNFVVAVNTNVTCSEVRNDTTGSATAGGRFQLISGVTLTANVYAGDTAVTAGCVSASTAGPSAIIGDVYAGTGCIGARNGGTQTLTISGTVYGNGYGPGSTGITAGIYGAVNASTGLLLVYRTVMGALGMPAVSGPMRYINSRAAQNVVRATAGLTAVTLRDVSGWVPDPGDVIQGAEYEGRTGVMSYVTPHIGMEHMMMVPASPSAWTPYRLFSAGEQGVWFDPSDWTTLYQDSAGTTPVTEVEQPVGLMLDKSKGLVLGPELVVNGDFSNGAGWDLEPGVAISAGKITFDGVTSFGANALMFDQTTSINVVAGRTYRVNWQITAGTTRPVAPLLANTAGIERVNPGVYTEIIRPAASGNLSFIARFNVGARTGSIDNISVRELPGNHAYQTTTLSRPTLRALYNELICQTTLSTQSITTVATSYTLRFTGTGTVTLSGTATGTLSAGTNAFTATAGALTLTVSGTVSNAMLTPTNEASLPFQSVTSRTLGSGVYDSDLTKFPPYLFFDGSDDSMSTNSINFSATDKVSVFAGVRRLADGGIIIEFETILVAKTFGVLNGDGATYTMFSHGSAGINISQGAQTPASYAAPCTNTLIGIGNISADRSYIYVNGSLIATATGDQGLGNFVEYPLYIGSRKNTSNHFNGRIYSLIVRGALTTTPLLEQTDTWVAVKTGVNLNAPNDFDTAFSSDFT